MKPIVLYHNENEVMRIICKDDLGLKEIGEARVRVSSQFHIREYEDNIGGVTQFYKLNLIELGKYMKPNKEYIVLPNYKESLYQPFMKFFMPEEKFKAETPVILGYSDSELNLRFILIDDSFTVGSFPSTHSCFPPEETVSANLKANGPVPQY
ncbi:hypothetical protein [Enterococcus sp. DIV1059_2]|uniref:hypothetical protein n=1 Tax=Enterococcus sp. DIV1059_2 TaxID=2774664 RepID=UPI003F29E3A5